MTHMMDLIEELWPLKRNIVSDGFDRALSRLADEIPMTIHEYPTGEPCWTWKVPEKWTCHEAYLETLSGKRLFSYADHPLHVVSYSLPFEGVVSRDELLDHLHVNPRLPESIPFIFKYYDRDWGLCATQAQRDALTDSKYRVVIRTSFEPGTLKVGEVVIPGESDQIMMVVAHLCHPAMANDDLTGTVVGLEAAREILRGPRPYYSYRLLILPETIGSLAYLSHHEELIPKMVGGLFLEMLGNDSAHALQQSFQPHSQPDLVFATALRGLDPDGYVDDYRTIICNDERQFNSPGVRVPMLSLSRVEPPDSPTRPFHEYHSSFDTPEVITQERLEESKEVVIGMLQAWDHNQYVVNNFKGEVFASGYNIWIDYRTNPEGHRRLFDIMERCDGERTIAEIAAELGTSFQGVWGVISLLAEKELAWLSRAPQPTAPKRGI